MRALELPPRLRLIAGWVPEGAYLADVGTDHGYLPTWLRLQGKIRGAVASDLRPGPLERAKVTGLLYGTDNIEYRLCNGLAGIRPSEVDTVTIAGMGGETILSILKAAPWTADGQHTLLLQPQSGAAISGGKRFCHHAGSTGPRPGNPVHCDGGQGGENGTVPQSGLGRRRAGPRSAGGSIHR